MLHALLSNREKGTMGDNFPAVWQYWLIFDVVAQRGTQRNKVLMIQRLDQESIKKRNR